MKKILFTFCVLMFLYSCGQKEEKINIEAQAQIMKQDPVSIEYFKAIGSMTKIKTEGGLDEVSFREIMKKYNKDFCNIDKAAFKGDVEMEKFASARCQFIKSKVQVHKKYPFLRNMNDVDKAELFSHLLVKQDYDIEKIKRNYTQKNGLED